jgi:hypothetical protein
MVIVGANEAVDSRRLSRDRRDDASMYKAYEQVMAAGSPHLATMVEVRPVHYCVYNS